MGCVRAAFDLHRPALALAGSAGLGAVLRVAALFAVEQRDGVRAGRHRRQYADEPGSRLAQWRAGLVRSSPAQAQLAAGRGHPLVAAGRSAAGRIDPIWANVPDRTASGAIRNRRRPAAAAAAANGLAGADRAAAGSSRRLAAGDRLPVLCRVDYRAICPDAD